MPRVHRMPKHTAKKYYSKQIRDQHFDFGVLQLPKFLEISMNELNASTEKGTVFSFDTLNVCLYSEFSLILICALRNRSHIQSR